MGVANGMNRQQKIRDILEDLCCRSCREGGVLDCAERCGLKQDVDEAMRKLDSAGCVLKVNVPLPEEGLYLPGEFRHPNWLRKQEVKAIMDLAVERLM